MLPDDAAVPAPEPEPAPPMSPGRKAVIGVAIAAGMVLGGFGLSMAWAQTSPPSTSAPSTQGTPAPDGGFGGHGHCHHGDRDGDRGGTSGGGTVAPQTAPQSAPNPQT